MFAGIYTFGNGLLFDRLFICVLVFTAVICRNNVNVLGVVIILVIQRLVEETAWSISELDYQTIIKAAFYFLALLSCWAFWYDIIAKLLLSVLILSIGSEFYWIYTQASAPEIYWYVGLIASNLFVRHLIFMRVSYTEDFFPHQTQSINLDWHIHKLNAVAACVLSLLIFEYFVRSVLGFERIVLVYSYASYALQAIATYAIWVIFYESYKMLIPRLLKA